MKKLITLILVCILVCGTFVPASAYTYNELVIADNLLPVQSVHDGIAIIADTQSRPFKYGLVDTKGNIIVEPYYNYMSSPSEGIIIVGLNVDGDWNTGYKNSGIDKYGAINTNGEVVLPVEYDYLGDFSEGLAAVYQVREYYEEMEYLGQVLVIESKIGFLDKTGKMVIPCEYDGVIGDFSEGKVIVQKNDKWGAIDKTGKTVVPFSYNGMGEFSNGLAYTWKSVNGDPQFGYVDANGKIVIPCIYDRAMDFDSSGFAVVGKYEESGSGVIKYGVIDAKGNIIAAPKYDVVGQFSEGLCYVGQRVGPDARYKYGYINYSGELVVPMIYDAAESFSEGLACIGIRNTKIPSPLAFFYGFIDTKGNVIVEPNKYDYATNFSEGIAIVGKNTYEEFGVGGYKSPYPPVYAFIDSLGNEICTKQEKIQGGFTESTNGVIGLDRLDETGAILKNPLYRESANALPTTSKVLVNGAEVSFDAYNINGNNYFKLRDLAYVLNGTQKQFEVTWDGKANAIGLIPGKAYTAVGAELAAGDGVSKTALACNSAIYINGKPVTLTAYNINGNNYFKLRDIGTTFNFDVSWDGVNKVISIDTSKGYSEN
ncbi:MAG: hypothetical protein E7472_02610 [Ruminococcaceae bacterium]|nr:hypothetical protein [Oscillospiraceae bacterium]